MFRFLLAAWLLWVGMPTVSCRAQEAPLPVPRFEALGVNEGLSQSTITAVYQDRHGFIWIGTGDGLNRFDGQTIQRFWVSTGKGAPPASYVRSKIWEDYRGRLWFTNEKGLHCYLPGSRHIQTIFTTSQWPGYQIARITDNQLWAWHFYKGILRYNLLTQTVAHFPLPDSLQSADSPYYCALWHAVGDEFWSKRRAAGRFCFFNPQTGGWRSAPAPVAAPACYTMKGRCFFLDAEGFTDYDSSTGKTRRVNVPFQEPAPSPQRMIADRWGRVWIATAASGLYCYQPATGALTAYRHNSLKPASLPTDLTMGLFIDRADNLWVGTDGGGVARLDLKPPRFGLFPLHESDFPGIKGFFVRCFYEDPTEKLWVGTHTNGICIVNRHTGLPEQIIRRSADGRPLQAVDAIVPDANGKLWIAHSMGFSLLDPQTRRATEIHVNPMTPTSAAQSYGTAILRLHSGEMLTASRQGLMLFRCKNGRWQGRSFAAHQILGRLVSNLCQMADSSIWAAVNGHGLLRLRRCGDDLLIEKRYFPDLQVRGLHCDERDPEVLWIATTSGFARLNARTGKADFKGTDEGMSNAYVYGLLEDEGHRLWMSTNGGLICYHPQDGQFATYTYADGLQSNEFNSGAFHKGASGTLYFGGIHGLNWIEKGSDLAPQAPPPVALSAFTVNGRQRMPLPGQPLVLPYHQNDMAFQIAVLDYTRPKANKTSCFLEGWDAGWIAHSNPDAYYANLPPGHYKLHIRGCNAAGIWSREVTYLLHIRAPFWNTTLFYVGIGFLFLLAAAAFIYAAFRRKLHQQRRIIAQQKALMDERARISQDMHDEIGSGLTRIAMMTEMLNLRQEQIPEIKSIAQAARGLVQSMGEIVWALHPQNDRLDNLLAYLREQLPAFIEPFELDYEIAFPETVPKWRLSNEERRNLYLTVRESVNNALKHAGASKLRIEARVSEQGVRFHICDNGRGFEPAQIRAGANGLRNMRRRMSAIGGYFDYTSTHGHTCICFGIPPPTEQDK